MQEPRFEPGLPDSKTHVLFPLWGHGGVAGYQVEKGSERNHVLSESRLEARKGSKEIGGMEGMGAGMGQALKKEARW